jgi:hypothetical protein
MEKAAVAAWEEINVKVALLSPSTPPSEPSPCQDPNNNDIELREWLHFVRPPPCRTHLAASGQAFAAPHHPRDHWEGK